MKAKYKLVRDQIPDIVNNPSLFRVVKKAEFKTLLLEKLVEEAIEFRDAKNLEELADVQEVFIAILEAFKFSKVKVNQVRLKKRKTRGAFEKKMAMKLRRSHVR